MRIILVQTRKLGPILQLLLLKYYITIKKKTFTAIISDSRTTLLRKMTTKIL